MNLDPNAVEAIAVYAAGAATVAFVLALVALVRLVRMRRAYAVLQGSGGSGDFVSAVNRQVESVERLRGQVGAVESTLAEVRTDLADALRHVAVVRYDAFPEMGGRLSFSAAFLDDAGDGLVLTSINGRSETRTYAKGVKAGKSEHSLSPEETQAIGFATRATRGARG